MSGNFDLDRYIRAANRWAKKNQPCPECLGVGCLPKDFGLFGSGKPCKKCKGKGFIKRN